MAFLYTINIRLVYLGKEFIRELILSLGSLKNHQIV